MKKTESQNIISRVTSNFIWAVLSEIGSKGLLFLSMIYLARVLGAEKFGIFSFAHIVTTYFWLAVDLGSNMYGAREVAKHRSKAGQILNSLLSLRVTSGFLVFIIFVLLIAIFSTSFIQRIVFYGFSFYLIFRSLFTEWFLRGIEKFNYIFIGNFITFGFFLVAILLLVKKPEDIAKAPLLWSISFLVGGIVFLCLTKKAQPGIKYQISFSLKEWIFHLRESIHFSFSGGLSTFYQQLPILLLGLFSTDYDVGLYTAVHRIIFALIFAFSVYPMAIYPIFSELYEKDRKKFFNLFKKSVLIVSFVTFPFSFLLFLYSRKICLFILGEEYINSHIILKILAGFFFLRVLREVFVVNISSAGLQRFYTIASVFGVSFIILAFFLIKYIFNVSFLMSASFSIFLTEIGIVLIMIQIWKKKIEV